MKVTSSQIIEASQTIRSSLADAYGDQVKYISGRAKEQLGLSAVLIRPDGIVAWASDKEPDISEIRKVVARWFVGIQRKKLGNYP